MFLLSPPGPTGAHRDRTLPWQQDLPWPARAGLVASSTAVGRGCLVVMLRLAYLGVTNALAMLRLLPMNNQAKDVEILAYATRSWSFTANCTARRSGSPPLTERCSPRYCTDSPAPCYARS